MSPQDLALELILRLLSLPGSVRTLLTKPVFSQQVNHFVGRRLEFDALFLCLQGDIVEQEGDSQSQGSATWLVDPKESKRTISTKYETTIFWVGPPLPPDLWAWSHPSSFPSFCVPSTVTLWAGPLPSPTPPLQPSLSPEIQHSLRQLCSSLMHRFHAFLLIISATLRLNQPSSSWYHSHLQPVLTFAVILL